MHRLPLAPGSAIQRPASATTTVSRASSSGRRNHCRHAATTRGSISTAVVRSTRSLLVAKRVSVPRRGRAAPRGRASSVDGRPAARRACAASYSALDAPRRGGRIAPCTQRAQVQVADSVQLGNRQGGASAAASRRRRGSGGAGGVQATEDSSPPARSRHASPWRANTARHASSLRSKDRSRWARLVDGRRHRQAERGGEARARADSPPLCAIASSPGARQHRIGQVIVRGGRSPIRLPSRTQLA